MPFQKLTIQGLRGFATEQNLTFAVPNGRAGSGLTVLVGPNNAGKSTVVEALRVFAAKGTPSFPEGRRNKRAGDRIHLQLEEGASRHSLRTVDAGGSETTWEGGPPRSKILVLPSRRHFETYFGKSSYDRDQYSTNIASTLTRGQSIGTFAFRLFSIQDNREAFNAVLGRVLDPVPHWVIELAESGQYYLKFTSAGLTHSSEGLGEGLLSLFFIVDALYDSRDGDAIVIDEPELSLHPAFQRRLSSLIREYAATRQIVLSTHSPYFVDLQVLTSGARIARVHFEADGSHISELSIDNGKRITALLTDDRNPHVLGLDAREAFFLDERIILVEGQDDVIHYARIAESLGIILPGDFFGWGVGGADKMRLLATALHELGFRKVVGLLDWDRRKLAEELNKEFENYHFEPIPAADVRSKVATLAKPSVQGLLDEQGVLRKSHEADTRKILLALSSHLSTEPITARDALDETPRSTSSPEKT
jgi:predicted ATPase